MSTFKSIWKRIPRTHHHTSLFPPVSDFNVSLPEGKIAFDEEGWAFCDLGVWSLEHRPFEELYWPGMHKVIREHYDNRLIGCITHYTALGDGRKTAKRFHNHDRAKVEGKPYRSVSTHFIVCRDGHIIQLASIHDRTWHAARKGLQFTVPATRGNPSRGSRNPNHWFVGVDLANWGLLKGDERKGWTTWTKKSFGDQVFKDERGRAWEAYPTFQVDAYLALMEALKEELEIPRSAQLGHSDIDPGRKIDPGPALRFEQQMDKIYAPEPTFDEDWDEATYWASRSGVEEEL